MAPDGPSTAERASRARPVGPGPGRSLVPKTTVFPTFQPPPGIARSRRTRTPSRAREWPECPSRPITRSARAVGSTQEWVPATQGQPMSIPSWPIGSFSMCGVARPLVARSQRAAEARSASNPPRADQRSAAIGVVQPGSGRSTVTPVEPSGRRIEASHRADSSATARPGPPDGGSVASSASPAIAEGSTAIDVPGR